MKMIPKFLYCFFSVSFRTACPSDVPLANEDDSKVSRLFSSQFLLFSLTVSVSLSSVFSFPIHQSSVVVFRSSVKFRLYNPTGDCSSRLLVE